MPDDDWTGMDRALWPEGRVRGRPGRGTTTYLCLPSREDSRLVVPLGNRRAAACSVRRRLSGASWQAATRRAVASTVTRSGAARGWRSRQLHVAGDGALTAVLSAAMGQEVVVALHLGARRANRKPVLEVMDIEGRVLAWGKLGVNELTDELVRGEAYSLARLGSIPLSCLEVPQLRANTQWRGHPLVLMTPLSPTRKSVPDVLLVNAASELADSLDIESPGEALTRYHETLTRQVASLPDTPLTKRMAAVVPELTGNLDGCRHGAWHGDWTPWNMGVDGHRLCVWDWERLATPVPRGMDLLHHRFQSEVVLHSRTPQAAALALLAWRLPSRARRTDTAARQNSALAVLYLLGLGARYLADDQAATGNRQGSVSTWLEPVLATWTSRHRTPRLPEERR